MLMISYNLAIKRHKQDFYKKADIIRLNSPWYTKDELIEAIETIDKPKFVDINIKQRKKSGKANHDYRELLKLLGKYNVEWVGISNVEDAETYEKVRSLLINKDINICAKIETELGCWHADDIIFAFDGIMVDIEDLAFEIGWKRATEEKDRIYQLCERNSKKHFRLSGVIFEGVGFGKIVYTYGAWDLLHPGHIKLLEKAKSFGEELWVGVVGDNAIKKLKGNDRPIQTQRDRMKIVESLKCVDFVVPQDDYDPIPNMEKIKPDILVKGNDWDYIPGQEWIELHGGKLIKPEYSKGWSTSKTVEKMK